MTQTSRFFRALLTTFIASLAIIFSIYFTFLARDFKTEILKASSNPCPEGFFELTEETQYSIAQGEDSLSHCYCSTIDMKQQWNEDLCRDYIQGQMKSSAMSYSAGFMVCFMNVFFTWLMDKAGSFEKHESLDSMEGSNMMRVFFLKFVNTGCLVLLYNQKLIQRIVGVKFEDPGTFDVNWYETGGSSMMIVMFLNIFIPHIGSLLQYRRRVANIKKLEKRLTDSEETDDKYRVWYTQEELNAIYLGPPFRLNYRYTQLLVNFYICWMYAISMPILTIVGAFSFIISYWVDKFLFCNFYRTPPKYSDNIGSKSTTLIGCSILLHIFMSTWILGNHHIFASEKIFQKGDEIHNLTTATTSLHHLQEIILKKHVVPLEIIGFLLVAGYISKRFFSGCGSTMLKFFRCLTCSSGTKVRKLKSEMNTVHVKYSNARARGVIKGLASYNILQNPKYQEAFQISPEFALSHNRLSSIRGYNTKDGDLCLSNHSSEYSDYSSIEEGQEEEEP